MDAQSLKPNGNNYEHSLPSIRELDWCCRRQIIHAGAFIPCYNCEVLMIKFRLTRLGLETTVDYNRFSPCCILGYLRLALDGYAFLSAVLLKCVGPSGYSTRLATFLPRYAFVRCSWEVEGKKLHDPFLVIPSESMTIRNANTAAVGLYVQQSCVQSTAFNCLL
jgi:hypothetical protein